MTVGADIDMTVVLSGANLKQDYDVDWWGSSRECLDCGYDSDSDSQCCQRARPAFSPPGAWLMKAEVRAGLKQSGPAPAGNHMD